MARNRRTPSTNGSNSNRGPRNPPTGLGRRDFLKLAGLSASTAGIPQLLGCNVESISESSAPLVADVSASLIRKTDFVVLRFDFINLRLAAGGTKLVSKSNGERLMVVTYPPQHILEAANNQKPRKPPASPFVNGLPVDARVAGPSRVVFKIPDSVSEIPFNAEALLGACSKFEMNVSPNALPPDPPQTGVIVSPAQSVISAVRDFLGLSPEAQVSVGDFMSAVRSRRGLRQLAQSSGVDLLPMTASQRAQVIAALRNRGPTIPVEPRADETSLELPFRLLMSPSQLGGWAHATQPVPARLNTDGETVPTAGRRIELWHSRLGGRQALGDEVTIDESPSAGPLRTIRALWTREPMFAAGMPCTFQNPNVTDTSLPTPASLSSSERIALVHQTSNFAPVECHDAFPHSPVRPRPVDVNRLMLSSLGGWLDSHGDWGKEPLYSIEHWDHRAAMGRDNYVKVVHSGVALPFGHRVAWVKVTSRKLLDNEDTSAEGLNHSALLWQRHFLVVREPIKTYSDKLRKFPFRQVHITTTVTPDLDSPENDPLAFIPTIDGVPYRLAAEAIDAEGNVIKMDLGIVWAETASGQVNFDAARSELNKAKATEGLTCNMKGQRIAFGKSKKIDDTTFEVDEMVFGYYADEGSQQPPADVPVEVPPNLHFLPTMKNATLQVEAARHMAGVEARQKFQYANIYLTDGFSGNNHGDVLLRLSEEESPPSLNFTKKSDRSGGFITPNLNITALSRKTGPIGGALGSDPETVADKASSGTFDPASFFAGESAKIFGVFALSQIIRTVENAVGLERAPKFITQALDVVESLVSDVTRMRGQLASAFDSDSDPAVHAAALLVAISNLDPDKPDKLDARVGTVIAEMVALKSALDTKLILDPLGTEAGVSLSTLMRQMQSVLGAHIDNPVFDKTLISFANGADLPKNLTVRLDWHPQLQPFPAQDPIFDPPENGLVLEIEARAKAQPGKPAGVNLLACLENFKVNLIAPATFMSLNFTKLQFSMEPGKKPDVDVVFDGLVFDGVLHFVENLRQIIPLDGFSDPPALDITDEGIAASFSLGLPNLACGMFALQNLSLGAGFNIPFMGAPLSVSFNFCTKENPCNLTVMCLGGGMWFGITVNPKEVQLLEAGFEFGATLAIDFGVASGSICVMAGFYFRMEEDDAQLSGYLRMRGEVDVMGLIGASIELRMDLTYQFSSKKLTGRASIEIEVHVLMFSGTVTITAERKFSGTNEDPSFEQAMGPAPLVENDTASPWSQYLGSFVLAA